MTAADVIFAGSIPRRYDQHLGPLFFQPYAKIAAARAKVLSPQRILETAAGTGIVTAELNRTMPNAKIVATDLNPAMLELAAEKIRSPNVRFQQADALKLPFEDATFDLVVCQFGAMFFPDKVKGNAEARRVLREGGRYLQIIWDRIELTPVAQLIDEAVAGEFPDNPPHFLERMPYSYADPARIEDDVRAAGFQDLRIEPVEATSRVDSHEAAYGLCCGSPMTAELAERGPGAVERAAEAAERALAPLDGKDVPMSAWFVTAIK
jgi:ubiquinone/menaquinone biosynthesis C-methylase UbiE